MNSKFFIIFLYLAEVSLDSLTPQVMLGIKIEVSGFKKESNYKCQKGTDRRRGFFDSDDTTSLVLVNNPAYNQNYIKQEIASTKQGEKEVTYEQPKVTEFFYNIKFGYFSHVRLIYTCKQNNSFEGLRPNIIDNLVMFSYAIFTTIKCNPCWGSINDTQFRGKIRTFPTLASTTFRAVNVLLHKVYIISYDVGGRAPTQFYVPIERYITKLKTDVIMYNLIKKHYYGPTHYAVSRFTSLNKTMLITLSHNEVISTKKQYLVGVAPRALIIRPGSVHYVDSFNFDNYELFPYEYVLFEKDGVSKAFRGLGMTYYLSYGYSGLNSQFKCTNSLKSSQVKKCTDSSIIKCANKYRVGFHCDDELTICQTNPCKFNGVCVNGTATNYECKCSPHTFGRNCEMFTCPNGCHQSECIGPNTCDTCKNGFSGPDCKTVSCDGYFRCRRGNCTLENNTRKCVCDPNMEAGEFCQFQCKPSCIRGKCTLQDTGAACVCDEGYQGIDCSFKVGESKIRTIPSSKNFIIAISLYAIIVFIAILIIFSTQINLISLSKNSLENRKLESMHTYHLNNR